MQYPTDHSETGSNQEGDSWLLRLVPASRFVNDRHSLHVGDCCYSECPTNQDEWEAADSWPFPFHLVQPGRLSNYYFANNSHRKPIVVLLPGREFFCPDAKCYGEQGYYGGWEVRGDLTLSTLTVMPSIDLKHRYHGWLTNNRIGKDIEGRTYNQFTGLMLLK